VKIEKHKQATSVKKKRTEKKRTEKKRKEKKGVT
jgi:hypothetical protein